MYIVIQIKRTDKKIISLNPYHIFCVIILKKHNIYVTIDTSQIFGAYKKLDHGHYILKREIVSFITL